MTDRMNQITVEFIRAEDRLLLKINTVARVELRLWLTRRVVKILWKALFHTIESQPAMGADLPAKVKQAVMAMQHQEAVEAGDFSKKPESGTTPHPLTGDRPLLVVGVNCAPWQGTSTTLTFQTDDARNINLNIDENILHALCHLLKKATVAADWGLDLSIGDAAAFVPLPAHQVH
jgi:hypothetical protein